MLFSRLFWAFAVLLTARSTSAEGGLRSKLAATPPKDVYAMQLTNNLTAPVNVTVTFVKSDGENVDRNNVIDAGKSWTAGPIEYTDGSATFRYVVSTVEVTKVTPGEAQSSDTSTGTQAALSAPFQSVTGVTPLLQVNITPDNADGGKIGSLQVSLPGQQ